MSADLRTTFHELHREGTFVIPNPWDVGSATMLAGLGFKALATTSSGHAASLGRLDQHVTRDELLAHAAALAGAVDVPISVDAERCFADDPAGVAETVRLLAETGVAGCSLEDYDPAKKAVDPLDVAVARVAAAAQAAGERDLVLTARAEGLLYRSGDLDEVTWANVRTWVDGPVRGGEAPAELRQAVFDMYRPSLELQTAEGATDSESLEPRAADRLAEVSAATSHWGMSLNATGSTSFPWTYIPKWRCGPVASPVAPTRPMR